MRMIRLVNTDDRGLHLVLAHVDNVTEGEYENDSWTVDCIGTTNHEVPEAEGLRLLAALVEDEDPKNMTDHALEAEWQRTEAILTRLGAELTRRACGE